MGVLAGTPALANEVGAGMVLQGFGASSKIQGISLDVGEDTFEPEPLRGKGMTLDGGGALAGGGIQANLTLYGVRVGLGFSFFGIEKSRFRHDPLPDGLRLVAGNPWGLRLDGFLGYEPLGGRVRPYLDLVASGGFVGVDVGLHHPTYGELARTSYSGGAFGIGPRGGLSVGLSRHVFADASVMYSIVGLERLRVTAGIGFRTN